jgi:hypothetical protein
MESGVAGLGQFPTTITNDSFRTTRFENLNSSAMSIVDGCKFVMLPFMMSNGAYGNLWCRSLFAKNQLLI